MSDVHKNDTLVHELNKEMAREEEEERRRGGGKEGERGRLTVFLLACLWVKPSKAAAVGLGSIVHTPGGVGSST